MNHCNFYRQVPGDVSRDSLLGCEVEHAEGIQLGCFWSVTLKYFDDFLKRHLKMVCNIRNVSKGI